MLAVRGGWNMYYDLFQIAQNKGIYQTMFLWAMLSPRLAEKETSKLSEPDSLKRETESDPGTVEDTRVAG